MEQNGFWDPVEKARSTDPETSHDAAASHTPEEIRLSQDAVKRCLTAIGPSTDERLVACYGPWAKGNRMPAQSPSGIRTRRRELVDKGHVHNTGKRAVLTSGLKGIVWAVTDHTPQHNTIVSH